MTIGQRVDRALAKLALCSEVAAVDMTRDHVSSSPAPSGKPAGESRTPAVVWAERLERFCEAAERFVHEYQHGATQPGFRHRSEADALAHMRQHIREYEGHDPVYVAFMEGLMSDDPVRRARHDAGLDRATGFPVKMLTAAG